MQGSEKLEVITVADQDKGNCLSVYISDDDRELINRAAKLEERSKSNWATRILRREAERTIKEYKKGKRKEAQS